MSKAAKITISIGVPIFLCWIGFLTWATTGGIGAKIGTALFGIAMAMWWVGFVLSTDD